MLRACASIASTTAITRYARSCNATAFLTQIARLCPLHTTCANASRLPPLVARGQRKVRVRMDLTIKPLRCARVFEWCIQADSNRQPPESESGALSNCAMGAYATILYPFCDFVTHICQKRKPHKNGLVSEDEKNLAYCKIFRFYHCFRNQFKSSSGSIVTSNVPSSNTSMSVPPRCV